ncbi:MAG: transcriptional regulator [Peptococcaceae bacterium BICA1-7]|nr:MAG: transcriptional regulator [Peptococcaceae bacterium BICA1-7]HBV96797.1 Lrp/AsnC family transcriptional regulator [Desulfotomaculum sp.]
MVLDNLDRNLLNIIQSDFPLTTEPYKTLAEALGTSEDEVLDRLSRLIEDMTIRRLGGIFDSRKLGYTGTLCAMKVPPDEVEFAAGVVNSYPGVTHNYLRDHDYNMWFTLLARDKGEISRITGEIRKKTGIDDIISLPAVKLFKIRVNFDLTEG